VLCPFCSFESTRVVDSRLAEPGDAIRRRRECARCGNRFTTYERAEGPVVSVAKRDGSTERFDRQKLLDGLTRAAGKRPVTEEQLEELAESIASGVRTLGPKVDAEQVGELALQGLARLDPVSGIQFASVYRNFADLDELEAELRRLKDAAQSRTVPSGPDASVGGSPQTTAQRRSSHAR
jgi:transcriptional repressor NrdR